MSLRTVVLVLAVAGLIQANTVEELVAEFKPQIASLQVRIKLALSTDGGRLGQVRSAISASVAQAKDNLNAKLDELENVVSQSKAKAADENKDIQACLDQETAAVSEIDTTQLDQCQSSPELNMIGQRLGYLGRIRGILEHTIDLCVSLNRLNTDALRDCIQNDIDRANESLKTVEDGIDRVLNDAVTNANQCVEGALANLQTNVDDVADQFQNCVANA